MYSSHRRQICITEIKSCLSKFVEHQTAKSKRTFSKVFPTKFIDEQIHKKSKMIFQNKYTLQNKNYKTIPSVKKPSVKIESQNVLKY